MLMIDNNRGMNFSDTITHSVERQNQTTVMGLDLELAYLQLVSSLLRQELLKRLKRSCGNQRICPGTTILYFWLIPWVENYNLNKR